MNEQPLTHTFTKLRKGFLRLALRLLPNEDDAHDALQEAFCKLWPRREQINTAQEAEALTVTTLRNVCIDKLRKTRTTHVELTEWRDIDSTERIDEQLEHREQYHCIEKIIHEQLSPLQQRILHMKEFDGETLDIIATKLAMQPTAVRMQLSRARKKIRTCYHNINKDENR